MSTFCYYHITWQLEKSFCVAAVDKWMDFQEIVSSVRQAGSEVVANFQQEIYLQEVPKTKKYIC